MPLVAVPPNSRSTVSSPARLIPPVLTPIVTVPDSSRAEDASKVVSSAATVAVGSLKRSSSVPPPSVKVTRTLIDVPWSAGFSV